MLEARVKVCRDESLRRLEFSFRETNAKREGGWVREGLRSEAVLGVWGPAPLQTSRAPPYRARFGRWREERFGRASMFDLAVIVCCSLCGFELTHAPSIQTFPSVSFHRCRCVSVKCVERVLSVLAGSSCESV